MDLLKTTGIVSIIVIGFLVYMTTQPLPPPSAKQREADAIAMCWKEHDRRSLDPAAKRFVARACETMESRAAR